MKKYLYDYISEIDELLESDERITDEMIEKHLIKINFFQHERIIHLYVTLFYGLLFIVFLGLGFVHYMFFPVFIIVLVFLAFYVVHYFRLENGVQYLYKQYDMMLEKKDSNNKIKDFFLNLFNIK